MIPLSLRVHNFMCYRDNVPTLDLRGIHLACLAGDNGHGKSALLDAMTWALWGKARVQRDDQLIHLGRTEMEVELEFQLDRYQYRVIRKRDSKRGQSVLELQGWDGERWLPHTESTMRATQARINDLLRMDYDTFINSAFLVQGRADEFTTKAPGERKRVLAEILGLSQYDEYAERAKERARQKSREAAEFDAQVREIDRELDSLPQYEKELRDAESRAAELSGELQQAEMAQKELQLERQALLLQQEELQRLQRRLGEGQRELAEIGQQLRAAEVKVAGYEELIDRRDEIEAGHLALLAAREAAEGWNRRLAAREPVVERRRRLEAALASAQAELMAQQRVLETRMKDLQQAVEQGSAQAAVVADAEHIIADLEELRQKDVSLQEKETAQRTEWATLQARNEQLRREMDDLKEKLDLLEESAQATCPLCRQPLDDARHRDLMGDFRSEGEERAQQWRANGVRLEELSEKIESLQRERQALSRQLRALQPQQTRLAQAQAKVQDGEAAAGDLADVTAELAVLLARLESSDYAPDQRKQLQEVLGSLSKLGYDAEAHAAARASVLELSSWEEQKRALERATAEVSSARGQVSGLQERQQRWQAMLDADRVHTEELAAAVAALPAVSSHVAAASQHVEALTSDEGRARLELGAARQRIDTCARLSEERKVKSKARQDASGEQSIYEELREAFGRSGLQAMIIEAALPEIEDEANQLLSRMTDGRMSVRLETQRELQRGGARETLDIIIADDLGPRPYDLYSGGEAFRVNFSLRVALSKLLARRAGAQLRTLFIDEGFGTQDAQGRERLVEAINAIKDDFERILVITHIDELKDMFPVRMDVVKTAEGSQVLFN